MQRPLAWFAGAVAGLGVVRALLRRRRHAPPAASSPVAETDARAAELRRKLDEARPLADEREAFEERELSVDQAEPAPPEERRRSVHEQARATAEEMRRR